MRMALEAWGLKIEHSEAGLYLWATAGSAAAAVRRLAELGILAAPGEFYGPAGERHVRVAVTRRTSGSPQEVARLMA